MGRPRGSKTQHARASLGHATHGPWILLGVYLPILVGTLARLAVINDVRFTGEEALFYSEAHKIAHGEGLPWYGPRMSGSGYHPGPFFFVICAVPLLLGNDPALVHAWIIVLNMLAVLLLARMTFRLHGVRAACIVSLLLSSSPWQFVYSVGIWQPHVMLPIFVASLWCLDRMKRVERSWSPALLVPLLLVSFQIHPSCVMVWLLAAVVLLFQRPRINWKAGGVGLVVVVIGYVPYLTHELKHGFENTRRVASDVQEYAWSLTNPLRSVWCHFMMTSGNINFHIKHGYWAPVPATLAGDLGAYWRVGDPAVKQLGWAWPVFEADSIVTMALAAGVALLWLSEAIRTARLRNLASMDALSLAFLACPPIVFVMVLLGRKPVYPNYVLFLLAAAFVGYVLLDRLLGRVIKPGFNVVVPVLAAVLFLPRLGVAYAYVKEVDSCRGLREQRAFARWAAERGPLKNVRGLEWYDSAVPDQSGRKEPIPLTLVRCAEPELLNVQPPTADAFSLAAEALGTEESRRAYLARRVRGGAVVTDFQVNARTTFLRWRKP